MRKHSSRSHKSKEPRVTFTIPEDDYNPRAIQENLPPNNDFANDSLKPKKSSTTSLASKFSKRWEHTLVDDSSRYNRQIQEESPAPKVSKDELDFQDDSQSPVSLKSYNYDATREEEVSDDLSDDFTRRITMKRDPSNQSAEAILQNINDLYSRVHEICNKK